MDDHDHRPWQAFHNREVDGRGWSAYGASRTGSNRAINEDNYLLLPLEHNRLLAAVADGLGGHNAGQIASRLACEALYDCAHRGMLSNLDDTSDSISQSLEAAVLEAHQTIAMWSRDINAFEGMGCTLIAAIIAPARAWYCHVGDSRLYRIGHNHCEQISVDQIVKQRRSSAMHAPSSPGGAQHAHRLDQALGLEEAHNRLKMQQGSVALREGDALLLCSDGLYGSVADQRLAAMVRGDVAIVTRVHHLIQAAAEAGSSDDVTAVLVNMAPGQ